MLSIKFRAVMSSGAGSVAGGNKGGSIRGLRPKRNWKGLKPVRAIHECTRELTRTRTCEYFNSKSGTRTRANLFPRVTCTRESSTPELQVPPPSLYQKWQ